MCENSRDSHLERAKLVYLHRTSRGCVKIQDIFKRSRSQEEIPRINKAGVLHRTSRVHMKFLVIGLDRLKLVN